MKNKNFLIVLVAVASSFILTPPVHSNDELYYSSAICTPTWQHAFDGSGEEGLKWNVGGAYWENADTDNDEWLVCPIPFDRSTNAFEVRTVVHDGNNTRSVVAQVTRQTNTGTPVLAASTGSSMGGTGTVTLFLTVFPEAGDRWINLYITVPKKQGSSRSHVYGLRVCRDCD